MAKMAKRKRRETRTKRRKPRSRPVPCIFVKLLSTRTTVNK